jgi:hypothetical protein
MGGEAGGGRFRVRRRFSLPSSTWIFRRISQEAAGVRRRRRRRGRDRRCARPPIRRSPAPTARRRRTEARQIAGFEFVGVAHVEERLRFAPPPLDRTALDGGYPSQVRDPGSGALRVGGDPEGRSAGISGRWRAWGALRRTMRSSSTSRRWPVVILRSASSSGSMARTRFAQNMIRSLSSGQTPSGPNL